MAEIGRRWLTPERLSISPILPRLERDLLDDLARRTRHLDRAPAPSRVEPRFLRGDRHRRRRGSAG